MNDNGRPELVIFDCDGVLVQSEPIVISVLAKRLRLLGVEISDEECFRKFVGLSQDAAEHLILRLVGSDVSPGWFDHLTVAVDAALRVQVEPTPGLVEVLDRLDIPVCLASNGRPEKVTLTLEVTGLARYFAGRVFTAADVERGKPAPDLFLLAASRMGAPPGRCVVVEDSETGVAAARAAGMRVVRYASDGGLPLDASEATFRRMAELPALLDGRPVDAVSRDAL